MCLKPSIVLLSGNLNACFALPCQVIDLLRSKGGLHSSRLFCPKDILGHPPPRLANVEIWPQTFLVDDCPVRQTYLLGFFCKIASFAKGTGKVICVGCNPLFPWTIFWVHPLNLLSFSLVPHLMSLHFPCTILGKV